jgi:hypothetical protein
MSVVQWHDVHTKFHENLLISLEVVGDCRHANMPLPQGCLLSFKQNKGSGQNAYFSNAEFQYCKSWVVSVLLGYYTFRT